MKIKLTQIIALIMFLTISLMSGCMTTNPDEQTVPWGRPADWEQSTPFFGG